MHVRDAGVPARAQGRELGGVLLEVKVLQLLHEAAEPPQRLGNQACKAEAKANACANNQDNGNGARDASLVEFLLRLTVQLRDLLVRHHRRAGRRTVEGACGQGGHHEPPCALVQANCTSANLLAPLGSHVMAGWTTLLKLPVHGAMPPEGEQVLPLDQLTCVPRTKSGQQCTRSCSDHLLGGVFSTNSCIDGIGIRGADKHSLRGGLRRDMNYEEARVLIADVEVVGRRRQ
mmetsp:Transcript_53612/g.156264  ORF Transcript_53612/g.156264 Transcript_53612/m.156264 type:complete len:232 (-) Transcript_53612:1440-2135(-)